MAGKRNLPIKIRFMQKVSVSKEGCWYWTAYCMKNGYGLFRLPKGHKLAHRVSYELFKGPLDQKLDVMHSCDNRNCVNPAHLSLGTRLDNMQDAKNKKRIAYGEKHGRVKLTEMQVKNIKEMDGLQKNIAIKFNVSQATVSEIKSGRKWAYLQ